MASEKLLTVLIPTRNNPAVGYVIDDIKRQPIPCDIVVVGHNTPPTTIKVIRDKGANVWIEPQRGKATAIKYAIQKINTPYFVILDADRTYSAWSIPDMVANLKLYDVVIGIRNPVNIDAMSKIHRLGNFGLSVTASLLYRHWVNDVCSGMWAFRTNVAKTFTLDNGGFTLETDFYVNTIRNGYKLGQIPITYSPRMFGKGRVNVITGLGIGWFLVRKRFKR